MRPARLGDLPALLELACHLDSPNLPAEEEFVRRRLERSERSFRELGPPAAEHEYQFALEDESGRMVGTSAILSKHGTPEMPHIFLRVSLEERQSEAVDVAVSHCMLQLGTSRDGPSELGSLVLLPETRGAKGSPGKLLSWGRFAFIARHPSCFEGTILAEMRAALDPEGQSAFWDAFGKRFTGMSYAEADRLSASDKRFILDLFPDTPFYATLLPEQVAQRLGEVHPEAAPAMRLLEAAGLHWIGEIDPFDAGPFIGAAIGEVIPIRETRRAQLSEVPLAPPAPRAEPWIASFEEEGPFRALVTGLDLTPDGVVRLPKEAARRLGACAGDEIALTPLPARSGREGARG